MLNKAVANSMLSEIPSEVFDAISPLTNKNSQAIFIALLKNEQMRFGEIKELFQVKNSEEVNHPLKSLVKAGLVSKKAEYIEDIGENEIAIYCPTFMGKSVMRSLYRGVMVGIDNISSIQSQNKPIIIPIRGFGLSYNGSNVPKKLVQFSPNIVERQPITSPIGGL